MEKLVSPLRVFLVIIFSVLAVETSIMSIFHFIDLDSMTKNTHSYYVLLDGVLLCLILSPLLFRYVYKPMRNSVKELDEARRELKFTIQELAVALTEVKQLRGIIPICATCKKIRNDEGLWQQIEAYIVEHSDADFSHSICPDCAALVYEKLEQLDKKEK